VFDRLMRTGSVGLAILVWLATSCVACTRNSESGQAPAPDESEIAGPEIDAEEVIDSALTWRYVPREELLVDDGYRFDPEVLNYIDGKYVAVGGQWGQDNSWVPVSWYSHDGLEWTVGDLTIDARAAGQLMDVHTMFRLDGSLVAVGPAVSATGSGLPSAGEQVYYQTSDGVRWELVGKPEAIQNPTETGLLQCRFTNGADLVSDQAQWWVDACGEVMCREDARSLTITAGRGESTISSATINDLAFVQQVFFLREEDLVLVGLIPVGLTESAGRRDADCNMSGGFEFRAWHSDDFGETWTLQPDWAWPPAGTDGADVEEPGGIEVAGAMDTGGSPPQHIFRVGDVVAAIGFTSSTSGQQVPAAWTSDDGGASWTENELPPFAVDASLSTPVGPAERPLMLATGNAAGYYVAGVILGEADTDHPSYNGLIPAAMPSGSVETARRDPLERAVPECAASLCEVHDTRSLRVGDQSY
jgi:hypothetical protein